MKIGTGLLGMFALTASAAFAEQPKVDIWAGCGAKKVSLLQSVMLGVTTDVGQWPDVSPAVGVERCTELLDDPGMAQQPWQRKAALLRSRARYEVSMGSAKAAVADLDTIEALDQVDDSYARSFGVSLSMIRALALVQLDNIDEATKLALATADARPWSQETQTLGLLMVRRQSANGAMKDSPLFGRLVKLHPQFVELRAHVRASNRDWKGALADWKMATPAPGMIGTTYIQVPNVRATGAPGLPVKGVDIARAGEAALVAELAGEPDLAQYWLTLARTSVDTPPAQDGFTTNMIKAGTIKIDPDAQKRSIEEWADLVEVAGIYRTKGVDAAMAALELKPHYPLAPGLMAMIQDMRQSGGTKAPVRLVMLADATERALDALRIKGDKVEVDPDRFLGNIPEHENSASQNRYRNSNFFRSGFRASPKKDGSGMTISYYGNKSKPFAIAEMALLRAAEMAREGGHDGFIITDRRDYSQMMTRTMYGVQVGPTSTVGFGSDLDVVFVNSRSLPTALAMQGDRVILASDVEASLAPIYRETEASR